jgi:peptidoglycan L-alanyl-D-glutamate endopeptidase CwlK
MSLSKEQQLFSRDLTTLLVYIFSKGYEVTFGEVLRTQEMQDIYIKTGKSKTSNSMHLKKCAVDLNFFKDGVLIETPNEIGKYWEGLSELNRWGGSWRGLIETKKSSFVDKPHFERKV